MKKGEPVLGCPCIMESLDEDIKQELLEKTEMLKCEYEAIQIQLIKEALLLNAQRKMVSVKRDNDDVDNTVLCTPLDATTSRHSIHQENNNLESHEDLNKHVCETNISVNDKIQMVTTTSLPKRSTVKVSNFLSAVRRSNRSTTTSKQTSSPVLCSKLKRKRRKLFPQLPVTLLQKLTDRTAIQEFALPVHLIESHWCPDFNIKHETETAPMSGSDLDPSPSNGNIVSTVPESPLATKSETKSDPLVYGEFCGHCVDSDFHISSKVKDKIDSFRDEYYPMALAFHRDHGYVAKKVDRWSVVLFVKKRMIWKKLWRLSSEIGVDHFQWMAPNNDISPLFLVSMNRKHSLMWVSMYDVTDAVGKSTVCRVSVENLSCIAMLPNCRLVAGGDKLTKFFFSADERTFFKETVFMTSDEPIVSLCDVTDKREAIIGCSTSHFYLWNHASGCLLQRIRADGIILKEITDSTSYHGLLICGLKSSGMQGCVAINPLLGLYAFVESKSLEEQQNRLNVYSHQTGSSTICDVMTIRRILEDFPASME